MPSCSCRESTRAVAGYRVVKFRWFELPDHHEFIYSVRSLVDGYFKVAAWLAISATFQVAAEATNSRFLWVICGLAYLMIFVYLQAFISWLGQAKFGEGRRSLQDMRPGRRSKLRIVRWMSSLILGSISFLVWAALMLGVQTAIGSSVSAIVDFQKSARTLH
jgi:hypothetical protein